MNTTIQQTAITKRFNFLSLIFVAAILMNYLYYYYSNSLELFEKTLWIIFVSIGIWFVIDYWMLRIKKLYYKSIILAITIIVFAYFLTDYQYPTLTPIIELTSYYPLSALLVQWPLRKIYKEKYNREPKVEKFGKSADLFYFMFLTVGFAALPFVIWWLLKTI